MRVQNMTSDKGNTIANQFLIHTGDNTTFQSYKTRIAVRTPKYITLDTHALNYSRTTSVYLYKFLGLDRKEILQRIKDKTIRVRNLNRPNGA